jgi:hypothetical protein
MHSGRQKGSEVARMSVSVEFRMIISLYCDIRRNNVLYLHSACLRKRLSHPDARAAEGRDVLTKELMRSSR